MAIGEQDKVIMPSEFMRQLRPELYSDTKGATSYLLDATTLEYHLESITSRNQTHDFEIFCRKLCERTICPNLKPATGPEGGGDSKADSETYPVADEIATLTFVGEANAGQERWAFAFSAKKKWAQKVRDDVIGIVNTQRGYRKIFCVTAQFAPAKTRARIEDELSTEHGLVITILDRSWIVDQIISHDRKDIAFNYLSAGQEIFDDLRLGPSDYSRTQQLEDIEKALNNPDFYAGMELQRVTEALVAAKLSRNLERPRTETDGRFARAIRFASQDGTYRQHLLAIYESIWTNFWWFDDVTHLNNNYDTFESLVIENEHALNLELLCNLAQLLFNTVLLHHLTIDEAQLSVRVSRLKKTLLTIADDKSRPNNALEAKTSLLVIQVNEALLGNNHQDLSSLWLHFSEVVNEANGLGEYSFDRLTSLIEAFGKVAGNNTAYATLVDDVSDSVTKRTGEAQGALVLLKRAQQLGFEDNFEMIRLLGKAAPQLTKKEYIEQLIESVQLLSLAYRSAGLLWAARASCCFSIASIFIDSEENSNLPAVIVPTLLLSGTIALELRHLPDFLEAVRLVRGCAISLPLDDASKNLVAERLQDQDWILASQLLHFTQDELEQVRSLPDVLEMLGLNRSRNSLLFALGHEGMLRTEGSIPDSESPEKVAEFFTLLASQPATLNMTTPAILNGFSNEPFVSKVQGMRVIVHHLHSENSILVAEAIIGTIEALFATVLALEVAAHTEKFTVSIEEIKEIRVPDFKIDRETMNATIQWPENLSPSTHGRQEEIQRALISLAAEIFASTCAVTNLRETVDYLLINESVFDRVAMILFAGNSRQRVYKQNISRLDEWLKLAKNTFSLESKRPIIVPTELPENIKYDDQELSDKRLKLIRPNDHRKLDVTSIIDVHLWDRAGWSGTAFALGLTVRFVRFSQLLEELELGRADGTLRKKLNILAKVDLLIIDDFGTATLSSQSRQDFLEVIDSRSETRSIALTSQIPVKDWHEYLSGGNPTTADAILDRLDSSALRINLVGESMRKKRKVEF